ncbi:MAG: molybdopterin-dependent oxidoreductase, partial [Anaerolineae bacterium]
MVKSPLSRRQFIRVVVTGIGVGTLAPLLDACARAVSQAALPAATPSVAATAAPATMAATAAATSEATATPTSQGVENGKGTPPSPTAAAGQVAITPNDDFYTVESRTAHPNVPGDWKLVLDGNVDHPISLTLDEIKAMPAVEEMRTLECISNPAGGTLISNTMWKGIRLKDLLARVGVKAGTAEL